MVGLAAVLAATLAVGLASAPGEGAAAGGVSPLPPPPRRLSLLRVLLEFPFDLRTLPGLGGRVATGDGWGAAASGHGASRVSPRILPANLLGHGDGRSGWRTDAHARGAARIGRSSTAVIGALRESGGWPRSRPISLPALRNESASAVPQERASRSSTRISTGSSRGSRRNSRRGMSRASRARRSPGERSSVCAQALRCGFRPLYRGKADISTLGRSRHFYFVLTSPSGGLPDTNLTVAARRSRARQPGIAGAPIFRRILARAQRVPRHTSCSPRRLYAGSLWGSATISGSKRRLDRRPNR